MPLRRGILYKTPRLGDCYRPWTKRLLSAVDWVLGLARWYMADFFVLDRLIL